MGFDSLVGHVYTSRNFNLQMVVKGLIGMTIFALETHQGCDNER